MAMGEEETSGGVTVQKQKLKMKDQRRGGKGGGDGERMQTTQGDRENYQKRKQESRNG